MTDHTNNHNKMGGSYHLTALPLRSTELFNFSVVWVFRWCPNAAERCCFWQKSSDKHSNTDTVIVEHLAASAKY